MPRSTTRYGWGGLMFTTRVKEITGDKGNELCRQLHYVHICHTQIERLATATSYDLTAVIKIDFKT